MSSLQRPDQLRSGLGNLKRSWSGNAHDLGAATTDSAPAKSASGPASSQEIFYDWSPSPPYSASARPAPGKENMLPDGTFPAVLLPFLPHPTHSVLRIPQQSAARVTRQPTSLPLCQHRPLCPQGPIACHHATSTTRAQTRWLTAFPELVIPESHSHSWKTRRA